MRAHTAPVHGTHGLTQSPPTAAARVGPFALLVVLLVLLAPAALAGGLQVSPVKLVITPEQRVASFELTNVGTEPRTVTLTGLKWRQDPEGRGDNLTSRSRDLLVTPAQMTIMPGQTQLARVGLRRAVPLSRQLTYRVLVAQISNPQTDADTGLTFLINYSLPVFVEAKNPTRANPQWFWEPASNRLLCSNEQGSRALRFSQLKLLAGAGGAVLWEGKSTVVLAGEQRYWQLPEEMRVLPPGTLVQLFDAEALQSRVYPLLRR